MKKDVDNIKLYMFFKISMGYKFTSHPPQLYAWTDEKILADIFKDTRNMDKVFRCKEVNVNIDAFNSMELKHPHERLVMGGFHTKDVNGYPTTIKFILTRSEEDKCVLSSEDLMIYDLEKILHKPSSNYIEYLKSDYLNALNTLSLFEYLVFTMSVDLHNDFYSCIVDNAEGIYMHRTLPQIDEAAVFVTLYGYTIKDGYKL